MHRPSAEFVTAASSAGPETAVERRRGERRRRAGDRLTGLADRDAFARAVDQADRDRDRLVVAVLTIEGLAEINQLCGYDVGDSLLSAVGRVLADRASVDVTVGRVGGSHLSLLQTPAANRRPLDLVEPVVDDIDRAIDRWLDDRAALGVPCPIVPQPRVGLAAGHGGATWSDAEVALAVAQADPDGPAVVRFDLADPRLADHRRRQRLADEVAEALNDDRLPLAQLTVRPVHHNLSADGTDGSWLRLLARPPLGRPRSATATEPATGLTAGDLALAPGLAGVLDLHLLGRAAERIERRPEIGATPERPSVPVAPPRPVSVPLLGPLGGPLSALAGLVDPPPGLVIEVAQDALAAIDPIPLAKRLAALQWRLAVTGFDGGWRAWTLVEHLPIHHVRPGTDLLRPAADGERAASTLLSTIGATAAERGLWLAADSWAVDDTSSGSPAVARLRELGVTHLDRAEG